MKPVAFDLEQEYEALLQFLYIAPVGLVQSSLDGEIAMINPLSAQLLMPLSGDGNLTNIFTALESVAPDLRNKVESFTLPQGMVCDGIRIPLITGSAGKLKPGMLSLSLLKLDKERLMAVINDITQQVARERLMKQNEAWLNAVMMGVTDYALVRLTKCGCIADWNTSIGRITGFDASVVGQPFSVFYPEGGTTPERVGDRLREADESGWSLDEGWRIKADGSRFWGSAMITPLDPPVLLHDSPFADELADTPGVAYGLVIRDITDKREASELQRKAIDCDHLTGIGNRRMFFEAAALEFTRGKRFPRKLSLVMFDLDHFKHVNDTHGHPIGDLVLRDFSALLASAFREVDVVARVGGEEFAVLLPSTNTETAFAAAERLRARVAERVIDVAGTSLRYTVSGGVATIDSDSADLEMLMKQADSALYAAKAAGRNRLASWPHPVGLADDTRPTGA
jgi:diguanylate cyclase (GGDEF)-like protein